uniref:C1q domain-containing protein n=1 Tax=Amphiprion ocellaris TaxID=80972 RepID=A0AAQ5ZID6_AMPOC
NPVIFILNYHHKITNIKIVQWPVLCVLAGEKGDQGAMGAPGAEGPQGETGEQGMTGPAGARGLPGMKGSEGPKGMKGDKGDLGRPGEPGMNGQKGEEGEQGMCNQGDMGIMGPRGPCSPAIQSAFSASINQSFPIHDWPISFPRVLTNKQGHFNPLMGIYTAPVNGTYIFCFHLAVAKKPLKVGLFHNFYPKVKVTEGTYPTTTSHKIVLHLALGDEVWMQVKNSDTNGMYTDTENTSTFSGFLLYPDSCEFPRSRSPIVPHPTRGTYSWGNSEGITTPSQN